MKTRQWMWFAGLTGWVLMLASAGAGNVKVSRFWHDHQPIYWPDWSASQPNRVQFAQDSIDAKNGGSAHPDNNLTDIFGHGDRVASYQSGPRNSLANTPSSAGYAISYSGSLIENVRSLGNANNLGYGSGWYSGNREAMGWTTPAGGPRLDMVGFTYHHSLGPVLPKAVFRKEIQIFKQAWWKAWGKNMDLSDHSKGFFPTEMAFSTEMIDVLRDEGYDWVIVASHHLSRTCPTYKDQSAASANYNINSSEPNRADQLGPSPTEGWWYASPNPGNAAWNVSPFAYQLHKVQYVNPETGDTKQMVAVPSDDVLSYKAGYSGAEKGMADNIANFANDSAHPVVILPATDGDNAWGGGSSSWNESWPSFCNAAAGAGWDNASIQDIVNQYGANATPAHIEDGSWIFPEMCYGSPYFLKWVDPPTNPNHPESCYPNTQVDLETPGFALKFWDWAPIVAGANWCETAEQIMEDGGTEVAEWKIATPYEWSDGSYNNLNVAEKAWHIYLAGLDSGFNYYGGLGNDDECKPPLANLNAINVLREYMNANKSQDATPPTIFRPQRFPYNPGGYTFGWFNTTPSDGSYRKRMGSDFYIWTHAYDVNGIPDGGVKLFVRRDRDGRNSMDTTHNETYAGGADVEDWQEIVMTKRTLPKTRAELNAAANNGQIDYEYEAAEIADYYFAKVDCFRGELADYYIEARDTKGNVYKSDIQHVYVEDDGTDPGSGGGARPSAAFSPAAPTDCADIAVTFNAATSALASASTIYCMARFEDNTNAWANYAMTRASSNTFTCTFANNSGAFTNDSPFIEICFHDDADNWESHNGSNWRVTIADCDAPVDGVRISPNPAAAGSNLTVTYYPAGRALASASAVNIHHGYNGANWTTVPGAAMSQAGGNWTFTYAVPASASNISMCFNDGSTWDNNGGSDWSFAVTGAVAPTNPVTPEVPAETVSFTNLAAQPNAPLCITYNPSNRVLAGKSNVRIHYGLVADSGATTNWTEVPGLLMTAATPVWTYTFTPSPGSERMIACFNDSAGTWDNNDSANWTLDLGANYPARAAGFAITNPPNLKVFGNPTTTISISGIADGLTGNLVWTNQLTGATGIIAAADVWTVPDLSIAVGSNVIEVAGTREIAGGVTTMASDSAANYTDWGTGANGGTGFGTWALNGAVENGAGFFIAGNNNTGCDIGVPAFGLWANGGNNAEAVRPLASPLEVGQTFAWTMENNSIATGFGVGTALQNASGDTLWQFFFNGGDTNYSRSGGDTDIAWTQTGLDIAFTLTSATDYSVTIQPRGGTLRTYTGTLESSANGQAIARFRAWNYSAGSGEEGNFYFDDLGITSTSETTTSNCVAQVVLIRLDECLIEMPADGGNGLEFSLNPTIPGATYSVYVCTNLLANPQMWTEQPNTIQEASGGTLILTPDTDFTDLPVSAYRVGYQEP